MRQSLEGWLLNGEPEITLSVFAELRIRGLHNDRLWRHAPTSLAERFLYLHIPGTMMGEGKREEGKEGGTKREEGGNPET